MFCVSSVAFNHESPRRNLEFVSRKITKGVAKISKGLQDCLKLGNLDSKRDWGHARDYVEVLVNIYIRHFTQFFKMILQMIL